MSDGDQKKSRLALFLAALAIAGAGVAVFMFSDVTRATARPDDGQGISEGPGRAASAAAHGAVERAPVGSAPAAAQAGPAPVELRGRVVDAQGVPVAGAEVFVAVKAAFGGSHLGALMAARDGAPVDPEVTGADGRFACTRQASLGAGVEVQAFHPGHARSIGHRDLSAVHDGVLDIGDVAMGAGLAVQGRVTDLAGRAVVGATVRLVPVESEGSAPAIRERLEPEVDAGDTGAFRFGHVRSGAYRLHASAPGFQKGVSGVLELKGEGAIDAGELRLEPGFRVTGQVTSRGGAPIAGAWVELRSDDAAASADTKGATWQGHGLRGSDNVRAAPTGSRPRSPSYSTVTDRDGGFVLEGLPGVSMGLRITAEGFLDHCEETVAPDAAPHIQACLREGLTVTGVVFDVVSGTRATEFAVQPLRVSDLPERDRALDRLARRAEVMRELLRNGLPKIPEIAAHVDGSFRVSGLREGVYVFDVHSRTHKRYRSDPVEVRAGVSVPEQRFDLLARR